MKDFLLISNIGAITYKEFFPLLKERKVSMGVEMPKEYDMPDGSTKKFGNICWFTTLHTPDKKKLVLTKRYHHDEYPHYDNYRAIEVSRIKDIPYDYDCVMGVPITIFDYDLDNVEIEGLLGNFKEADCNDTTGFKCGDDVSAYNLPGTQNGPVIITSTGPEAKYKRVLIRNKRSWEK